MTNPLFPKSSQPIKLYGFDISGHSHRVQLMLSLLDLPYELVQINVWEGEHKTPEHLQRHPFGQIPVMEDNGTDIWDSNAILVYLAVKYDAGKTWYPEDAVIMANIQKWLSAAAGPLVQGPVYARAAYFLDFPAERVEKARETAHVLLDIVEMELHKMPFICSEQPTIADISLYTYIAHAPEGGIDLSKYEAIQRWLQQIEALKGFVSMKKVGG